MGTGKKECEIMTIPEIRKCSICEIEKLVVDINSTIIWICKDCRKKINDWDSDVN